jgi:3-deoxy-D-manno-octulosonate 8-phosphate phosphatase (KDO 8-P phosphatase)
MPLRANQVRQRAKKIKLLLMDVDGVLTDGRIYYVPGTRSRFVETKTFHARDGLGIRFAHEAGMRTGIISGRRSPVVEHRARELGIHYIFQDVLDKLGPYQSVLRAARVPDESVCYVGDDLVDLPILCRVGLAVGIGDGHPFLRQHVHYWTVNHGGNGAIRETVELILAAQGKLEPLLKYYLS